MKQEETYQGEWKPLYLGGNEEICLNLTREIAHCCYHQGECDDDCAAWVREECIADQLKDIDDDVLKKVLMEYFCDSSDDVLNGNRESNLMRLLWLAAGEFVEQYEC